MTRLESELHDLAENIMRNDDMADKGDYLTIYGIANEVSGLEAENAKLRELCTDLVRLPAVSVFDCYGCKYDEWTDCRMDCKLIERAIELGIEVK